MARGGSCHCHSASVSAQPLLVQSSVQSQGESIVRSLSEGTASAHIELQNPRQKQIDKTELPKSQAKAWCLKGWLVLNEVV